ncbi:hypothetical protein [Streptomyces sp. NPDC056337]|uniref:hypothetical protein n=1 Tax=Streptomyces sp. NPDC056337 TaxID=3345787 RepID=UPI0035DA8C7A
MTCASCSRPPRRRGCDRRHRERRRPQGVGLTDFAQGELGKIVFVRLHAVEQALTAGQFTSEVEAEEKTQEIYAPVAGTAVNGELGQKRPEPSTRTATRTAGSWRST